nr:hypothetical protein [Thiocapsa sp.]
MGTGLSAKRASTSSIVIPPGASSTPSLRITSARRVGKPLTALLPEGKPLRQCLVKGGARVPCLQRVQRRSQSGALGRRRNNRADVGAEGQDRGLVMLAHRGDPIAQRVADAPELGCIERRRDVHQKDIEHALAGLGEGGDRHDLGRVSAERGLQRSERAAGDRIAGLVAHRYIGREIGPLGQRLDETQTGRHGGRWIRRQSRRRPGQQQARDQAGTQPRAQRPNAGVPALAGHGLASTGQLKDSPQKGTNRSVVSPNSIRS